MNESENEEVSTERNTDSKSCVEHETASAHTGGRDCDTETT